MNDADAALAMTPTMAPRRAIGSKCVEWDRLIEQQKAEQHEERQRLTKALEEAQQLLADAKAQHLEVKQIFREWKQGGGSNVSLCVRTRLHDSNFFRALHLPRGEPLLHLVTATVCLPSLSATTSLRLRRPPLCQHSHSHGSCLPHAAQNHEARRCVSAGPAGR